MFLAIFGDFKFERFNVTNFLKSYHVDFVYYVAVRVASNSFSIVTALTVSLQLALAHTKRQFHWHHFQIEVIIRPGYIDEFH